jgi:hypothetical protein
VDDTGLADFTGRRGLFFLSDRMRARAEERFRGNVVRHAFSGRRANTGTETISKDLMAIMFSLP